MKSIISDILGEIVSKYKQFISSTTDSNATKETATNRLRLVLMHDRTNLAPDTMEKMRDELLEVISKYVVVDEEALDLNLAAEGDAIALLASIPILRAKTKEEQEEAIKALEEKKKQEAQSEEETDEENSSEEEAKTEQESQEVSEETKTEETDPQDDTSIEAAIGKDLVAADKEAQEAQSEEESKEEENIEEQSSSKKKSSK
jgi:cell division topological specificity factor